MLAECEDLYNIGEILLLLGCILDFKENMYGNFGPNFINVVMFAWYSWEYAMK